MQPSGPLRRVSQSLILIVKSRPALLRIKRKKLFCFTSRLPARIVHGSQPEMKAGESHATEHITLR